MSTGPRKGRAGEDSENGAGRRECGEPGCERPSCMPEPYPPECARHYLASVTRAQREAKARFDAHVAELRRRRRAEEDEYIQILDA